MSEFRLSGIDFRIIQPFSQLYQSRYSSQNIRLKPKKYLPQSRKALRNGLVNILHLFLGDFMRHEFIISGVGTINNTFRSNFDDVISNRLNELVVM